MPVYWLTQELLFPPPEGASPEGVVAVGGDFSPERLVLAYSQGIFPWPHEGMPLLWFSPDPRFVLALDRVHVSRSLRKSIRKTAYRISVDRAFGRVMEACAAAPRPDGQGTWISQELMEGFQRLHQLGYAHSVETWSDRNLVGGLYGVSLGNAFFGESMFALVPDASKLASVALFGNLRAWGFHFVDCQVYTEHLARSGAANWPRTRFLRALRRALGRPTRRGPWRFDLDLQGALERIDFPSD